MVRERLCGTILFPEFSELRSGFGAYFAKRTEER